MKRILLTTISIQFVFYTGIAQQAAQYTQYMVNPYLMNPALSSVEDMIDIKTGYRSQWVGFKQNYVDENQTSIVTSPTTVAPRTMYLSGHAPIGKPHMARHFVSEAQNWFGVGGKVVYDQTGPSTWGSYMVSGTYNMGIIKPKSSGVNKYGGLRMSAGMFIGFQQYSLDWDKLNFANDLGEPLRGANTGNVTQFMPDASLGIWLYNEKVFFGLSGDHIFGNKINYPITNDVRNQNGTLARHYFATGGINYSVNNQLTWSPSVLMKFTTNAPLSIDFNNKIVYEDNYFIGLSYRHLDAISVLVGAVLNDDYEFAYSYDFTTTDIRTFGNAAATHEITLGYRIQFKPIEINPVDHQSQHSGHYKGKKRRYR